LESGGGVSAIDFPADEGTAAGGWDGVARTAAESPFVPAGLSLWELSVNTGANSKAEDDYSKRDATPDGSATTEATYCQLILRRWTDRATFAKDKSADGRWLKVRAYGVDDVEAWLESAPVTHAWISEQLGLQPYGMQTADAWWNGWAMATDPVLTTDVVLAGRTGAAQELLARLGADPTIVTLRADSRDEALAFIAAVLLADDSNGSGSLLSRTAFVDDVGTWCALADHTKPLILVARTPEVIAEARGAGHHHVIVPLSTGSGADITLPPLDAQDTIAILKTLGLEDRKADDAGRLARRSLLALRRHLATKPELHQPSWAEPPVDRVLRAILLASQWSEVDGDMEAVGDLAGTTAEELGERLIVLASHEDPVVDDVDRTWTLVSPYDAWLLLQDRLTAGDLGRFRDLLLAVLLEPDPFAGMSDTERMRAQLEGKGHKYSADLHQGLATSLALLGTHGGTVDLGRGTTAASWADGIVRDLMQAANDANDIAVWTVLASMLPCLAEASPEQFLSGVRAGVQGNDPLLRGIFQDAEDGTPFGPHSPHSALLWGIEATAWSPDHFGAAVDLLARLDEIDPGGRLSNRPFKSLKSIFCGWHPDNTASWDGRLAAIDGLRERHPDTAGRLMLQLLPDLHGIHDPTYAPRFRDWKPDDQSVSRGDYDAYISAIADRLRRDAGKDAQRWRELLSEGVNLGPEELANVRTELSTLVDSEELGTADRTLLWEALRELVATHREFRKAAWALSDEDVSAFEEIAQKIQPEAAADAGAWLFAEHMPNIGDEKSRLDDFAAYKDALAIRRRDAICAVEDSGGFEAVCGIAKTAAVPIAVGWALAEGTSGKYDGDVLSLFDSNEDFDLDLAGGFFAKRFVDEGWGFVDALLASHADASPTARARLLLATEDFPKASKVAEADSAETRTAFWTLWPTWGLPSDSTLVVPALRGLLSVDRCAAALDLASQYLYGSEDDPSLTEVLCESLDALLGREQSDPEIGRLSQNDFEHLFEYLEKHRDAAGIGTVGRLEWAFLQALGYEPAVPSLHATLADDPNFFVDVMKVVYRGRSDESASDDDQTKAIASNGYRLLSSWRSVPGLQDDDLVDESVLGAWVSQVLDSLKTADRAEVGELQIGHMLASAPADPDGRWPSLAVRNLLEKLQSERVEDALRTEIYNRRGITMRDPEAGGGQERQLAEKYRTDAAELADRWPRTAAVLRSLAESYERDARHFDDEAEKRRRGMN